MLEILPIKIVNEEDGQIFGPLNLTLAKLARVGFPISNGIVISAPELHLKSVLEHYEFSHKEVFEQSLTLVKKEIAKTPVPEILFKEIGNHGRYLVDGEVLTSHKSLWLKLLDDWLEEIKQRLWQDGFYPGITEGLSPARVIFVVNMEAFGVAYFDPISDDVIINTYKGKIHPNDQKNLYELVLKANKKLFIPYEYEWIIDRGLKLTGLKPFTGSVITKSEAAWQPFSKTENTTDKSKTTIKVFLDLSEGLVIERDVDGIYISTEKIFDLNKPQSSLEELIFKLVESGKTFPEKPILVKLADMSEGMGKIRGALRLIHQKSLLDPLLEAIVFARNKQALYNINVVLPFIRSVNELLQLKRDLASHKLIRKNNFQVWMEVAIPENVVNLEDYLTQGLDGIVLNLDELSSHLSGYDHKVQDVAFYKHQVTGMLKFLEDAIKLLHKSKIPYITYGSLSLNQEVLDFLVEKGVYGIVAEKYEAPSMSGFLHQVEKRMIFKRET